LTNGPMKRSEHGGITVGGQSGVGAEMEAVPKLAGISPEDRVVLPTLAEEPLRVYVIGGGMLAR